MTCGECGGNRELINTPTAHFIYGCIWFSIGVSYLQTQLLTDIGLGLFGIFVAGLHLMVGLILIMGNYDQVINLIKNNLQREGNKNYE